jgi:hypothetical protein
VTNTVAGPGRVLPRWCAPSSSVPVASTSCGVARAASIRQHSVHVVFDSLGSCADSSTRLQAARAQRAARRGGLRVSHAACSRALRLVCDAVWRYRRVTTKCVLAPVPAPRAATTASSALQTREAGAASEEGACKLRRSRAPQPSFIPPAGRALVPTSQSAAPRSLVSSPPCSRGAPAAAYNRVASRSRVPRPKRAAARHGAAA